MIYSGLRPTQNRNRVSGRDQNMKSYKIICVLFGLSHLLLGQTPVITQGNYFRIGDKYISSENFSLISVTPGSSGENTVWNFSNIDFNHSSVRIDTISIIDPENTPFFHEPYTNYDTSNFCILIDTKKFYPNDNDYHYFRYDSSKLEFIGNWADNGTSELGYYWFSNLRTDLIFPFKYNDVHVDSFQSSHVDVASGRWHFQKGTKTISADGYGTLILSGGDTIFNVLRLKEALYTIDSSFYGVGAGPDSAYTWYSSDRRGPVLRFVMWRGLPNTVSAAQYYKSISDPVSVRSTYHELPTQFLLCQNFPNPFNPATIISYALHSDGIVLIKVYDALGREVKTLVNEFKRSGRYTTEFDASMFPSGIYFYKIISGDHAVAKKMVLIK